METLKPGQQPKKQQPAWTGKTIDCPTCGAKFKLKATDRPASPALDPKGRTCFYCAAPGCGTLIPLESGG